MTSKEAFNILWDELELYCSKHNDSVIHYWKLLEIIKEDLDILEILEIKNKDLEHELDREEILVDKIIKERDKYKKAVEILKDNFPIKFLGYNKYGTKPYEIMINGYIQGFDKEPYELLKEALENEINN